MDTIRFDRCAAVILTGAMVLGIALPAAAQQSGVLSQGCAAHWRAESVMDMKLPNYSTNGFWQTVP